ncbi:MAG: hypothetical protein U0324_16980 [Polyangiales bacterium]
MRSAPPPRLRASAQPAPPRVEQHRVAREGEGRPRVAVPLGAARGVGHRLDEARDGRGGLGVGRVEAARLAGEVGGLGEGARVAQASGARGEGAGEVREGLAGVDVAGDVLRPREQPQRNDPRLAHPVARQEAVEPRPRLGGRCGPRARGDPHLAERDRAPAAAPLHPVMPRAQPQANPRDGALARRERARRDHPARGRGGRANLRAVVGDRDHRAVVGRVRDVTEREGDGEGVARGERVGREGDAVGPARRDVGDGVGELGPRGGEELPADAVVAGRLLVADARGEREVEPVERGRGGQRGVVGADEGGAAFEEDHLEQAARVAAAGAGDGGVADAARVDDVEARAVAQAPDGGVEHGDVAQAEGARGGGEVPRPPARGAERGRGVGADGGEAGAVRAGGLAREAPRREHAERDGGDASTRGRREPHRGAHRDAQRLADEQAEERGDGGEVAPLLDALAAAVERHGEARGDGEPEGGARGPRAGGEERGGRDGEQRRDAVGADPRDDVREPGARARPRAVGQRGGEVRDAEELERADAHRGAEGPEDVLTARPLARGAGELDGEERDEGDGAVGARGEEGGEREGRPGGAGRVALLPREGDEGERGEEGVEAGLEARGRPEGEVREGGGDGGGDEVEGARAAAVGGGGEEGDRDERARAEGEPEGLGEHLVADVERPREREEQHPQKPLGRLDALGAGREHVPVAAGDVARVAERDRGVVGGELPHAPDVEREDPDDGAEQGEPREADGGFRGRIHRADGGAYFVASAKMRPRSKPMSASQRVSKGLAWR